MRKDVQADRKKTSPENDGESLKAHNTGRALILNRGPDAEEKSSTCRFRGANLCVAEFNPVFSTCCGYIYDWIKRSPRQEDLGPCYDPRFLEFKRLRLVSDLSASYALCDTVHLRLSTNLNEST